MIKIAAKFIIKFFEFLCDYVISFAMLSVGFVIGALYKAYMQYAPNATQLPDILPNNFFSSTNPINGQAILISLGLFALVLPLAEVIVDGFWYLVHRLKKENARPAEPPCTPS